MYNTFIQKEIQQNLRNYKIFIIVFVFIFFGFLNPIMARLMNEILALSDVDITLPNPTVIDAWQQFYKNYTTLLFVFLFTFSSIITDEFQSKTIINILIRGIKRSTIILVKFLVLVVMWCICYSIYFFITYLYTPILLEGNLDNLIISAFFPLLFGIFMIMLLILGSVITKNTIGAVVVAIITYLFCSFMSLFENLNFLNPYILVSKPNEFITNMASLDIIILPMVITIIYILIGLLLSISIFNRCSI